MMYSSSVLDNDQDVASSMNTHGFLRMAKIAGSYEYIPNPFPVRILCSCL